MFRKWLMKGGKGRTGYEEWVWKWVGTNNKKL